MLSSTTIGFMLIGLLTSVPQPRRPLFGGLLQPSGQPHPQREYKPAILSALYGYNDCIGGVNTFDTQEEYMEVNRHYFI